MVGIVFVLSPTLTRSVELVGLVKTTVYPV